MSNIPQPTALQEICTCDRCGLKCPCSITGIAQPVEQCRPDFCEEPCACKIGIVCKQVLPCPENVFYYHYYD